MVGVIGVGLFAVFQAQKSIRLPTVSIESDAATDDVNQATPDVAAEDELPTDRLKEAPPTVVGLYDDGIKPAVNSARRQKNEELALPKDITIERGAKTVTKTLAKGKQTAQILPVKRMGIDFNESDEPEEKSDTDSAAFGDEPTQLPADAPTEVPVDDPMEETSEDAAVGEDKSTEDKSTEKESDPFSDDGPNTKTESEEKPEAEPAAETENATTDSAEEPQAPLTDKPGKSKISSEFESDPPPPRSNRAKRKSEKRSESPLTDDVDAFGTPPDAAAPSSKKTIKAPVVQDDALLDPPSRSDEQEKAEFKFDDTDSQPESSKSEPVESTFPVDDQALSTGPLRTKDKSPPARMPAVLPDSNFDDVSTKKRESGPRRGQYDTVTQTDMIGDGDIGDPSQRGVQQPRLTIEKIAQQQAVLGQPLIYSIVVKNVGNVDAHNVVVEDRIPKGTELKGTSPQAELSGKRLIWNHPLLRPNEEKKISIKVVPHQEGPIGSVARIYFATEVSTEIVVAAPQLDFNIKSPREVRMGQRFDMVFLLKNVGKVDATNIVVRDIVPESLKNEAGNDIECPVGKLAPNESREIVLTVTATKTGTVMNQIVLTADSGVRKSYENEIDVNGEVLVLTRSGHNQLYVERSAIFTNNVRNDGNQRADRVKISEVVPAGMQFETASDGGKFDPQARAVVWTLGPLAPGSDRSVTVKYMPKETGTLASNITATGNLGSTATVNASVKVIGKPELQMETHSATGSVTVGERITSRFQLNNSGTASANNVQLRIRLPAELRLITARGAKYRQDGDELIFEPIVELAPKSKASFELLLEPIAEADAQIELAIAAEHLSKPGRRIETIQIARDALK